MSQDIHTLSNQAITRELSKVTVLEFTVSELQTMKESLYETNYPYEMKLINKIWEIQSRLIHKMEEEIKNARQN
jgi:hypothetical protein